ncbi:MAG: peptide ABC transporter substrate-binding protein [Chloroflexota bacterium]|nr:peptide ABC transporter substrate-binding protein [Chloroflexota bacterium]
MVCIPFARSAAVAGVLTLLVGASASVHAAPPSHRIDTRARASTTLIYGTDQEPDTLNRLITQLETADNILAGVMETLVRSDAHDNFVPDLATTYTISTDNLTYTFHLRHGVKWADGAPFTAKDVVFTYQQIKNPKNNTSSTLGWDHITRVDTPDNYTVVFHTTKVYAPFLTDVGETAILPAHYFQHSSSFVKSGNFNHDPYNRTPFGTGPYKVTEWKSADHITLVPNAYYWGHKPYFQRIVVKIVPNVNTLLVQLRTDEVQLASITQQQVAQATGIPGKTLIQRPGQSWYHIDLKQYGFMRDQKVRLALDYATPKQEILAKVLHGYGQIANGDIAPISWAYPSDVPMRPFSLKTAAALLAADGFSKGSDGVLRKGGQPLAIQLWFFSSDAPGAQIDEILKYEWGQLGVKVDLHHQDVSTIFGAGGPQFTKQMTAINYAWFNGNDPDDAYYWNSAQIPSTPTGAGGNDVGYFYKFSFQKQIDDLTTAGIATVDRTKRKAIYARIERLLADQVPVIFLDWEPLLYVQPKGLQGFNPNAFSNLFYNIQDWHY